MSKTETMKTLHFFDLPDTLHLDTDIIGWEGLILGRDSIYPNWQQFYPFQQPLKDMASQNLAEEMVLQLWHHYSLPKLKTQLSQKWGFSKPDVFWEITLGPWAMAMIQTCWAHYCKLLHVVGTSKTEPLIVKVLNTDTKFQFDSHEDFQVNGLENKYFHCWLLSHFIKPLLPETWQVQSLTKPLHKTIVSPETTLDNKRLIGIEGIQGSLKSSFHLLLQIKSPSLVSKSKEEPPSEFKRYFPKSFIQILNTLLPLSLPISETRLKSILTDLQKERFQKGKWRFVGENNLTNDVQRLFLAEAKSAGERLALYKQNSQINILNSLPGSSWKLNCWDKTISWGDLADDVCPHPLLLKFQNKHSFKLKNALYLQSSESIWPTLSNLPKPDELMTIQDEKKQFILSLTPHCFSQLEYRQVLKQNGCLDDKGLLLKSIPDLRLLRGHLLPQMMTCRALILDAPNIYLYWAMTANIPVILFFDPRYWRLSKEATPFFQALESAGIWFKTGKEAAEKLNDMWEVIPEWWAHPSIQETRKGWVNAFVKPSTSWKLDWIKEIKKLGIS